MRKNHRHSGQSLVEFALIGSLLVTLLLGTFDFALAFNNQLIIRSAVAEGGYFIAQNPGNTTAAEERMMFELNRLPNITDPGRLTVTFATSGCVDNREDVSVTVRYRHSFTFVSVLPGAEVTLEDSSTVPQFGSCT